MSARVTASRRKASRAATPRGSGATALLNGKQIEALWRRRAGPHVKADDRSALISTTAPRMASFAPATRRFGRPLRRCAPPACPSAGAIGWRNCCRILLDTAARCEWRIVGQNRDASSPACVDSRRSSDRPRGSKRGRVDGTRRRRPGTGRAPPPWPTCFTCRTPISRTPSAVPRSMSRASPRRCGRLAFTVRSPRPGTSTTPTCTTMCRSFASRPSAAPILPAPMGRPTRERRNRSAP